MGGDARNAILGDDGISNLLVASGDDDPFGLKVYDFVSGHRKL